MICFYKIANWRLIIVIPGDVYNNYPILSCELCNVTLNRLQLTRLPSYQNMKHSFPWNVDIYPHLNMQVDLVMAYIAADRKVTDYLSGVFLCLQTI